MSQLQYAPAAIALAWLVATPTFAAASEASQIFGNAPEAVHLAALTPAEMHETKGAQSHTLAAIMLGLCAGVTFRTVKVVYNDAMSEVTNATITDVGRALAAANGAGLAVTTVMALATTYYFAQPPVQIAVVGPRVRAWPGAMPAHFPPAN